MTKGQPERFVWARLALLALLCGCSNQGVVPNPGDDPDMPTINSITPTGTVGEQGEQVQFSADVSGSGTIGYSWNFGSAGTVDSTTSATPTLTLGTPDTYLCSLTVLDSTLIPAMQGFSITITAALPHITEVTPTAEPAGLPAETVTFSAEATNSPTSWEWDFGAGAVPSTSTDAEPEVRLGEVGTHTGTVTATNANGEGPAEEFTFTVEEPVFPAWTIIELEDATIGQRLSAGVLDDRLAIAYNGPDGVHLARAQVEFPESAEEFTDHLVAEDSAIYNHSALIQHAGRLVLWLGIGPNATTRRDAHIAMSDDEDPANAGDWTIYPIPNHPFPKGALLSEGDDLYLISSFEETLVSSGISFGAATTTIPLDESDWAFHMLPEWPNEPFEATLGLPWGLAKVGDHRYAVVSSSSEGGARYHILKATTWPPEDEDDWEFVADFPGSEQDASLLESNDHLVLVYDARHELFPTQSGAYLSIAVEVEVGSETPWNSARLTDGIFGGAAIAALGRLAVPIRESAADLRLFRQVRSEPLAVSPELSWDFGEIDPLDSIPSLCAIALLGDRLAIAYRSSSTGKLRVAIAQTRY